MAKHRATTLSITDKVVFSALYPVGYVQNFTKSAVQSIKKNRSEFGLRSDGDVVVISTSNSQN